MPAESNNRRWDDFRPGPVLGIDYTPFVITGEQFRVYRTAMAPFRACTNVWFNTVFVWANVGAWLIGLNPVSRQRLVGPPPQQLH
jgi:hypothetical protein